MDRKRNDSIIISIALVLCYSIISYFLMFYYSGIFSSIFCFPYAIAFLVGFGLSSEWGYILTFITFFLIWYMFFLLINRYKK